MVPERLAGQNLVSLTLLRKEGQDIQVKRGTDKDWVQKKSFLSKNICCSERTSDQGIVNHEEETQSGATVLN